MPFDIDLGNKISFEEDDFIKKGNYNSYNLDNTPKMIKLVIKVGLVKNKQQANILLLSLTVVLIIVTVILIRTTIETVPTQIPYEQLSELQKLQLPEIIRNFHEK